MKQLLIAIAIAGLAMPVLAQDHSEHDMTEGKSAATTAYMDVNSAMHAQMDIEFTGDPDVDFILSMLPHHQGAVDMAKIVLEHGSDPEVRKLAQDIIAAQETEIAWMKQWLATNGHDMP